ncbi:hypothetical protein E3N88_28999 [Mikania micrantha]|uniref:Uncharacterized protein n=1 Tax=Mikania micrantha TaxID=192012 RepID=A0A5N6N1E4_9ASTR|nr:hypothetical protein E3N88_28999 [Mikania micrantha]
MLSMEGSVADGSCLQTIVGSVVVRGCLKTVEVRLLLQQGSSWARDSGGSSGDSQLGGFVSVDMLRCCPYIDGVTREVVEGVNDVYEDPSRLTPPVGHTHAQNPNFVVFHAPLPRFSVGLALDRLYFHVEGFKSFAWTQESPKSAKKRGSYGDLKVVYGGS